MRRLVLLLAASLAAAPAAAPALAQPVANVAGPPPAAAFPETALGRIGRGLVDAINAGDSVALGRFLDGHVGVDVLRGGTPASYRRTLTLLHAQSGGGVDVMRVRPFGPTLRVYTRARNGRRWLGIELVPSAVDSTRLAMIGLHPMDDPSTQRGPAPWPDGLRGDSAIADAIRARVREAAAADEFSGVVLVAHGDRVLVHEAVGLADREAGRPNTPATTFGTTSVGKMFTGVAVAQLVARGKLRLDDTLARVLPEYPNADAARRVTVRQLLTHTAGVPEPFQSPRFRDWAGQGGHAGMLATFADAPLTIAPGSAFQYSNGNYATLAAVVEKASGMSYEAYLRRHVWGPAGMRHLERPGHTDAPGRAVGYARFTDADPLGLGPRRPSTGRERPYRGPLRGFGGGAFAAEDLFRFMRALRTGKLLGAPMTDSATAGAVPIAPGAPVKYAMGFYDLKVGGARLVGHSGSNPDTGFDADVEALWDGEWTVVVLSNYDAPAGVHRAGAIIDLLAKQPLR